MEAVAALTSRVSAARLVDPAPEGAALEAILGAGLRAPDHGRLRPWKFLLVRGPARERLGELMADSLRRREPSAPDQALAREREKVLRAPLILVVAASIRDVPKIPDVEQVVSAGAAAQNMLVAAHALGFGGMWKTGPAVYDEAVKAAFGLQPRDTIVGFLYFGTPEGAEAPRPPDPSGVVHEWPGA